MCGVFCVNEGVLVSRVLSVSVCRMLYITALCVRVVCYGGLVIVSIV